MFIFAVTDQIDTTMAEVKKKRGRPPKNPHPDWGGVREGAGRPKKPASEAKYPETIAFRASPIVKARYNLLKEGGTDMNEKFAELIDRLAKVILGPRNPQSL